MFDNDGRKGYENPVSHACRWLLVVLLVVVPVLQLSAGPGYASPGGHDHHGTRGHHGAARVFSRVPAIVTSAVTPPAVTPLGFVVESDLDAVPALDPAAPFVPPRA
jgi:hypothetical protein